MREIKFREWWIHPESESSGFTYFEAGKELPISDPCQEIIDIQQYTGLKDKNGKEIYEGDVVRILYTDWPSKSETDPRSLEEYMNAIALVGSVFYQAPEWLIEKEEGAYPMDPGQHGFIEVIGNIYENPELLK